mmetsp:Transcript_50353/g.128138  ORF Transcript_50353/g.128138 Transcript_50353/m.128138 type:complete len:201 (+) Transcript_50353:667-1269(+)
MLLLELLTLASPSALPPTPSVCKSPSWSGPFCSSLSPPSSDTSSCFAFGSGKMPSFLMKSQISFVIMPSSAHFLAMSVANVWQIPLPVDPPMQATPKNLMHFSCAQKSGRLQHMSARMMLMLFIRGLTTVSAASRLNASVFSHCFLTSSTPSFAPFFADSSAALAASSAALAAFFKSSSGECVRMSNGDCRCRNCPASAT